MAADPFRRFRRWHAEAVRAGADLAEAVALATADARGRPSVRYVLLKACEPTGFVFYTNSTSRKGADLAARPYAALAFYWHATGRQVRVEGAVEQVSDREADEYWASRPRESRIASLSSEQSQPLASRAVLLRSYRHMLREHSTGPLTRPRRWTGYRIVPDRIEFWTRHEPRLHHRELFERTRSGWKQSLLQP
jgi:pyridoxamine 5'-phosphate oxidase